ncbi:MAG: hypothetical protein ABS922_09245 [Psychrobacillus psychrotolerans]
MNIDFVADLKKNINGLYDLHALTELINELEIYFKRKIDLLTYQQINEQYPSALARGINLRD